MNQQPFWFAKQQLQYSSTIHPPRTTGRIIVKITLYFVGVVIAEFGFIGGLSTAFARTPASAAVSCLSLSVGMLGLIGGITIFFRKEYYLHCLLGMQYLWLILGASGAFIATFGVLFGVTNPNANPIANAIAIGILTLYGVSLIWIAHLKPPMIQQINTSVYHILKKMPGKQIVASDLLARLQKKYQQVIPNLHQYLGNLEYIELVTIPGAPEMVYRMKPQKKVITVSQMTPPPVSTLRSQAGSLPFPVHQNIPPPSIQSHPPNNQKPKERDVSLADQKTVPALPIAIPNQKPALPPVQSVSLPGSKTVDTPAPPPNQTVVPPAPSVPNSPAPSSSLNKEQKAIRIFCCYAHEDEQLLDNLKKHLKPQQRQGLIQIWHDRDILAGAEWEKEVEEQLNTAQVVLLLVSPDFMASDYCYTKEMQRVLERHKRNEVRAIPIILRPTDWLITPLGKLQALPKDGKPITTWANRDQACLEAAIGIRTIVATFLGSPQQPKKQIQTLHSSQRTEEERELICTRCSQGKLIITNKKIAIELTAFGKLLKSQILLRTSLTSIDSKLAVPSVLGKGGGMNLTFHGKGRELLKAELVPPRDAQKILVLLS